MLYTGAVKRLLTIFYRQFSTRQEKLEILKSVICFLMAHEFTHVIQDKNGRQEEMKLAVKMQEAGDSNSSIEREANEGAYYFMKRKKLLYYKEIGLEFNSL